MTEDLNTIASYLARRDVSVLTGAELGFQAEVLALIGSSLIGTIRVAAEALRQGSAKMILIAGGIGHSTQDLRDIVAAHPDYGDTPTENRAEADIMSDILINHFGVDGSLVLVENRSTNCGSNASESRRVLYEHGIEPRKVIIVQDPTMQMRTHVTFQRVWKDVEDIEFISFAPFVPKVLYDSSGNYSVEGSGDPVWAFDRFASLVLGEVVRLRDDENGYGPRGRNFFDHVDVPQDIIEAYERVAAKSSNLAALR